MEFTLQSKSALDGSNVLISEVYYDTIGTDAIEEWVELYNPTTSTITMNGWSVTDNAGTFTFSSSISPNGYLVLAKDTAGYQALYGSTPDITGMTIALSNSGDQVILRDGSNSEVDAVYYENFVIGWSITASTGQSIVRSTAIDTDSVSDWTIALNNGEPGMGNYGGGGTPDTTPPTISITNPTNGALISGSVLVSAIASDNVGISSVEFYIDNNLKFTDSSSPYTYSWNTVSYANGSHTIKAIAYDGSSNSNFDEISVTTQNNAGNTGGGQIKIMVYNIKESGESATHPDWDLVVQEENADIIMFVETGTWDDNNNAKLNQHCSNFNTYFSTETPYDCYTTQGISFTTSGEAIMSRYPVVSVNQVPTVLMDDGSSYTVTHDIFDVVVDVGSQNIHLVGEHLKCCTGATNEQRRESEQEGVNNYFDSLGDVPIIYLGDFNSFSPEDIGINTLQTGLGYGPMSMLLGWPGYENKAPVSHTFTDVHRSLYPTDLGISNPDFDSRIDFIYTNQHFTGMLLSSTTGDTAHAATGSDHFPVDVLIDFSGGNPPDTTPPTQVTGLSATTVSDSQIDLNWTANTEPDLDHYNIYREGAFLTTSTTNSYSDFGLTGSTTYSYTISAVDTSTNEGLQSSSASATTNVAPDTTPPAQVTGLIATTVSDSQIDLSWTANTELDLDHYNIYRDGIFLQNSILNSYTDTGLTGSTTYTYIVSAVDTSTNEGLLSSSASATTLDIIAPSQVTGLRATTVSDSQIDLSWVANTELDLDHYSVYKDGVFLTTVGTNSFSDTGLTPSTSYTYTISAIDTSANEGLQSSSASATTNATPVNQHVLIFEVFYDTPGTDSREEWIELYNPTSSSVVLNGWTIADNAKTYTLNGVTINANSFLIIARQTRGFNRLYGFNPDLSDLTLDLGNSGDQLTLRDSNGVEIDFVAWENYAPGWNLFASTGQSIQRNNAIDTDSVSDWSIVNNNGNPGAGNTTQSLLQSLKLQIIFIKE